MMPTLGATVKNPSIPPRRSSQHERPNQWVLDTRLAAILDSDPRIPGLGNVLSTGCPGVAP